MDMDDANEGRSAPYKCFTTDDRGCIDEALDYLRRRDGFDGAARAFQERHGVVLGMIRTPPDDMGGIRVVGVRDTPGTGDLPGRWCKPDRSGLRRPYRNNRDANRLLGDLSLPAPGFPGMPGMQLVVFADGRMRFEGPSFFVHAGRLWVRIGASADPDKRYWTPVRGWEYGKALEASRNGVQPGPEGPGTGV